MARERVRRPAPYVGYIGENHTPKHGNSHLLGILGFCPIALYVRFCALRSLTPFHLFHVLGRSSKQYSCSRTVENSQLEKKNAISLWTRPFLDKISYN